MRSAFVFSQPHTLPATVFLSIVGACAAGTTLAVGYFSAVGTIPHVIVAGVDLIGIAHWFNGG